MQQPAAHSVEPAAAPTATGSRRRLWIGLTILGLVLALLVLPPEPISVLYFLLPLGVTGALWLGYVLGKRLVQWLAGLWQDWQDALVEDEVGDCRWTPCSNCGVCDVMDTHIQVGPSNRPWIPVESLMPDNAT